jgi:hypothetical protein
MTLVMLMMADVPDLITDEQRIRFQMMHASDAAADPLTGGS